MINLPLDGPKKVHDSMREKGHYDVVMNALENIDKPFTITTVLTKKNVDRLVELAEIIDGLSREKRILNWKVFKFKPKGRGAIYRKEFEIGVEEFLEAKEAVKPRVKTYFIEDPDRMGVDVVCKVQQPR